jgi:HEAT repeat protein
MVKVVLKRPAANVRSNQWTGELQTSRHRLYEVPHEPKDGTARARLPFPDHFPGFTRERQYLSNGSGLESAVTLLRYSNRELSETLDLYDPAGARREVERQLAAALDDEGFQLYLAALAARFGSQRGAFRIVHGLQSTDYYIALNAHSALRMVIDDSTMPPQWSVRAAMNALADQRHVTGLEKTNFSPGTDFTISYLADEHGNLTNALGDQKCETAVPLLIDMVRRTKGARGPVNALGEIGDPRAIPALMDVLREHEHQVKIFSDCLLPESFTCAATALAKLKAKEARSLLLNNLCHSDIVEALERLSDPRAIPALERLVADGQPKQVEGSTDQSNRDAVGAARIALATLRPGDPISRYGSILADQTLGEYVRRGAVWRLGDRHDARAVPHLLRAIKSDPSGSVVNQAISVLGTFKTREAVEGLIGCFDANFDGKNDWKRALDPAMFRENLANSLRKITGEPLGADRAQWESWWKDRGSKQAGFQQ